MNIYGKEPNLSLDRAPAKRTGKRGWIHLDLYTPNQADVVKRLVNLEAARCPWVYPPGADYVVLEDPDGNLFCVIQN
jgi:catechol 2,3-dioxygenase-like lactoylglutathione lyase family enzyme